MKKAVSNKCPNCGGNLIFDPKTQKWNCKYCNSLLNLENIKKHREKINTMHSNNASYLCPNCGANIIVKDKLIVQNCIYCQSQVTLQNKDSKYRHPDYVLPFQFDLNEAKIKFKKYCSKRVFFSKKVLKKENIKSAVGIYLPFWLVDYKVQGMMKGRIIKTHINTEVGASYEKEGEMYYEQVPYDGSQYIKDEYVQSINPYDYNLLKEFDDLYLSGFSAEHYDVDELTLSKSQEKELKRLTQYNFEADILKKGNVKNYTIDKNEFNVTVEDKKYALLPVYFINIVHENQKYIVLMNGQTGKIYSDLPIYKSRVVLLYIKMILTFFLVTYFALVLYQSYKEIIILAVIIWALAFTLYLKVGGKK